MLTTPLFPSDQPDLLTKQYPTLADIPVELVHWVPSMLFKDAGSLDMYWYGINHQRLVDTSAPRLAVYAPGFTIDQDASGYNRMVHDATSEPVGSIVSYDAGHGYEPGYGFDVSLGYPGVDITPYLGSTVEVVFPGSTDVFEGNFGANLYAEAPWRHYWGFRPASSAPSNWVFVDNLGFCTSNLTSWLEVYPSDGSPWAAGSQHAFLGIVDRSKVGGAASDISVADVRFGLLWHGDTGYFVVNGVALETWSLSTTQGIYLNLEAYAVGSMDPSDPATYNNVTFEVEAAVYSDDDPYDAFSGFVAVTASNGVFASVADFDEPDAYGSSSLNFSPGWDGSEQIAAFRGAFYEGGDPPDPEAFWTDLILTTETI